VLGKENDLIKPRGSELVLKPFFELKIFSDLKIE